MCQNGMERIKFTNTNKKGSHFYIHMESKFDRPSFVITLNPLVNHDWVDFFVHNDYLEMEKNHKFDEQFRFVKIDPSKILTILKLYSSSKTHLLLHVNNTNFTSMMIINIKKKLIYSEVIRIFGTVKLSWKSRLHFEKYKPAYFIMLPGNEYNRVTIQSEAFNVSNISAQNVLKVYWIPEKQQSRPLYSLCCETWCFCFNFSSSLKNMKGSHGNLEYFAYLLHPLNLMKPIHINGTWNEASGLCKSVGGYLPIIRSRVEQDEIMALLGSSHGPPMKLIFIGLFSNFSNKVRYLFCLIDNY